MPEVTIKYKPGVVPGEYVEKQARRAPELVSRVFDLDIGSICVEARPFGEYASGFADEEVGIISSIGSVLNASLVADRHRSDTGVVRIEERHENPGTAGLVVARVVMKDWRDETALGMPINHETIVSVYPIDMVFLPSSSTEEYGKYE